MRGSGRSGRVLGGSDVCGITHKYGDVGYDVLACCSPVRGRVT